MLKLINCTEEMRQIVNFISIHAIYFIFASTFILDQRQNMRYYSIFSHPYTFTFYYLKITVYFNKYMSRKLTRYLKFCVHFSCHLDQSNAELRRSDRHFQHSVRQVLWIGHQQRQNLRLHRWRHQHLQCKKLIASDCWILIFEEFQGDSGGPLVYQDSQGRYVQIGVTSFGSGRGCAVGAPAVFTRVSSYVDNFIKQHLQKFLRVS